MFQMKIIAIVLMVLCCVLGKDQPNFDHHIFPCRSTDYLCFKRQYKSLRNHVLLGEKHLSIDNYEPYVFKYGSTGTCVKISGIEDSELIGIRFDSSMKELSLLLDFPLKIRQIIHNGSCRRLKHDIEHIESYNGTLHNFTGNATIEVNFPYELKKNNNQIYLDLKDQEVDMLVDIPDLRGLKYVDYESYLNSEWAYKALKSFDAAEYIASPYTNTYRIFAANVPLSRYIMLYPEEQYEHLTFSYNDEFYEKEVCQLLLN